jgi:hypothetical protein
LTHPPDPGQLGELQREQRAAWKQYWPADGARYHLSNRQMGDAITVMERVGMARQVPVPPFPQPASYGASSDDYDAYLDAVDRGEPVPPSPALAAYLDARDQHLRANYDARVIPRHKLWTNDGWLITPRRAGRRPPPRPHRHPGPPQTAYPLVDPVARLPRRCPRPRRRPGPLTSTAPAARWQQAIP